MRKEFKLTMYAAGEDEIDAVESAVKMLNEGATFDQVNLQRELPLKTDRDE